MYLERLWLSSCVAALTASIALPASALPCFLPPDPLPAEADCDLDSQSECTKRNSACVMAQGICDDEVLDCGCALPAD